MHALSSPYVVIDTSVIINDCSIQHNKQEVLTESMDKALACMRPAYMLLEYMALITILRAQQDRPQ